MKIVFQRVTRACVRIDGHVVGKIGGGAVLLVGFREGDGKSEIAWMAKKVVSLRVFADEQGRMNRSLQEIGGSLLIVSQFTLEADTSKGRRPSYARAARPERAEPLYLEFVEACRSPGIEVETGQFGAHMSVEIINDGPVTLLLERIGNGS